MSDSGAQKLLSRLSDTFCYTWYQYGYPVYGYGYGYRSLLLSSFMCTLFTLFRSSFIHCAGAQNTAEFRRLSATFVFVLHGTAVYGYGYGVRLRLSIATFDLIHVPLYRCHSLFSEERHSIEQLRWQKCRRLQMSVT